MRVDRTQEFYRYCRYDQCVLSENVPPVPSNKLSKAALQEIKSLCFLYAVWVVARRLIPESRTFLNFKFLECVRGCWGGEGLQDTFPLSLVSDALARAAEQATGNSQLKKRKTVDISANNSRIQSTVLYSKIILKLAESSICEIPALILRGKNARHALLHSEIVRETLAITCSELANAIRNFEIKHKFGSTEIFNVSGNEATEYVYGSALCRVIQGLTISDPLPNLLESNSSEQAKADEPLCRAEVREKRMEAALVPSVLPDETASAVASSSSPVEEVDAVCLMQALQTREDSLLETESRVRCISELVSSFSNKTLLQKEMAYSIVSHSIGAIHNVEDAKKHLKIAKDNQVTYRTYLFYFYIGSGFFILILDFLTSRRWL